MMFNIDKSVGSFFFAFLRKIKKELKFGPFVHASIEVTSTLKKLYANYFKKTILHLNIYQKKYTQYILGASELITYIIYIIQNFYKKRNTN